MLAKNPVKDSQAMLSYTGKLIRLRPLRKSDMDRSVVWRNDPEVRDNFLGVRFPVTEKMEENWFESALEDISNTRALYAIETIQENSLAGFVYLTRIDWIARLCYFGILIGEREYQGKGFGQEAMHLLFTHAFGALNLRKICLEVVAYNTPAIHLYRKFGFQEEGRLRQQVYLLGAYHDLLVMGLLASEYFNRYQSPYINS